MPSWRSAVDVLSLGATKNGALSAEAIVTFDPGAADELVYRTKRAGHVTSKMRFQSAQLIAYLTDGEWLRLATNSNVRMAELADGLASLGLTFANRPDANMLFVQADDRLADRLAAEGLRFYRIGPGLVRFVTSWQTSREDVAAALDAVRRTAERPT